MAESPDWDYLWDTYVDKWIDDDWNPDNIESDESMRIQNIAEGDSTSHKNLVEKHLREGIERSGKSVGDITKYGMFKHRNKFFDNSISYANIKIEDIERKGLEYADSRNFSKLKELRQMTKNKEIGQRIEAYEFNAIRRQTQEHWRNRDVEGLRSNIENAKEHPDSKILIDEMNEYIEKLRG